MNIVIVGGPLSRSRAIQINSKFVMMLSAAILVVVAACVWAGLRLGGWQQNGELQLQVAALQDRLVEQDDALLQARQFTEDHLDALAVRVGELQARSTRVEALGKRLTEIGGLNEGEFNFSESPGMGGPEPVVTSVTESEDVLSVLNALENRIDAQTTQLSILETLLAGRELNERFVPNGRPVDTGWMSSPFGNRADPFTGKNSHHPGIDYSAPQGSDIFAVADGVVTWSGPRSTYGNTVEIDHGNGYTTRYAHCSETLVVLGQKVSAGQIVGKVGDTGRATAAHLHFEVLLNNRRLDPIQFVKAH